jgi:hypothetical protein
MVKGFTQREGMDYNEIFSPSLLKDSFRIMMALVTHLDSELHHMDVKTACLNGDLYEKLSHGSTQRFCHERKGTYGMPPEQIHL